MLPCGKTICNICIEILDDLKQNEFTCDLCSEEHLQPKKGFPINEIVAELIREQPNEVYRSKESEMLKTNLSKLEQLVHDVKFDMENGVDKIKDHCIELRRQVQLATEHKIQEINSFNDSFIKQIDHYEKECAQKLAINQEFKPLLETAIEEIKKFLIEKRHYLGRFQISEEEIYNSNEKSNEFRSHLEFQKLNIKSLTFNNKLLEFETNKNRLDEIDLGFLHFKPLDTNLMFKQKSGTILVK